MNIIVVVDKNWGIGKNNDLLFNLPLDMQFFKEKTLGKVVVMGGNTLLSFPNQKPLPKRTNIVLSDVFKRDDCLVFETLKEVFDELKKHKSEDVFVIGGGMFYNTMLPFCDTAYITKVDADGGATLNFKNLDEMENWVVESESDSYETNGFKIKFLTYKNKKTEVYGG